VSGRGPVNLTIALDAMGGDHAPQVVIAGADMARERFPGLRFLLYGDHDQLRRLLQSRPELTADATIEHTPDQVGADAKPSQVLRHGRKTSMGLAIDAVKDGRAAAAVSAGNTGALMALAKFVLKTLPGIERPAIASLMPTRRSEAVFLDLGANAECDAANLVQFAVMGEVFARAVLGIAKPTVGLLNIGTEEVKGHEKIREAAAALRASDLPIEFRGFVEGTDVTSGKVDVVVTDGFTGNVALKVAEGTVALYTQFMREAFRSSLLAKLGYYLARPALQLVRQRLDPRRYNGAMFLGLNGIVVKSHGGTDALGFANAIGVAVDLVQQGTNERITGELHRLEEEALRGRHARAS
jgi:glycerol-3-phosphate acyltransferase PlsX